LLLVGLLAKMLVETLAGTNIFVSDTSFVPVPIAHLIGAVIGLTIGFGGHIMLPRKCNAFVNSERGILLES
jgi:NhaP-type Na+/H+ or K+/H+ antiporter